MRNIKGKFKSKNTKLVIKAELQKKYKILAAWKQIRSVSLNLKSTNDFVLFNIARQKINIIKTTKELKEIFVD